MKEIREIESKTKHKNKGLEGFDVDLVFCDQFHDLMQDRCFILKGFHVGFRSSLKRSREMFQINR